MKLLIFQHERELRLGIKLPGGILDVKAAAERGGKAGEVRASLEALLAGGPAALAALTAFAAEPPAIPLLDEAGIVYGPCVPNPGKIVCLGMNYQGHTATVDPGQQPSPILFAKYNNTLAACGEVIPLPTVAEQYDYEAELAVVIGRRTQDVPEDRALEYVFGYCNANDLSARELQKRTSQWMLGKTLDKFFPIGPYLVTTDEVPDPQALMVRGWVNGELGQEAPTAQMIFPVPYLISYISRYFTLEPGDIISTGTPGRVPRPGGKEAWLKAGDVVTIEVQGLGRLTNTMG